MTMKNLINYRKIVGKETIDEIHNKAETLSKKHILFINSTYYGGGVAEMLNSMVYLFNDIGMNLDWRTMHGSPDFFSVTKKFHNALQGDKINLSEMKKKTYYETNRRYSTYTHINHHNLIVVHDPQPLPLIEFYEKKQPWIFRCHLDLLDPNPELWDYLRGFVEKYNHFLVSHDSYKKKINTEESTIYPAIDPLSLKNQEISEKIAEKILMREGVDPKKPIISQVSRYDKWKDPEGVIRIFKKVKEKVDCQLVLVGNTATDDPEGARIYNRMIKNYNNNNRDVKILVNVDNNERFVNALQRKSSVVIQKSTREGFGLTVSEALYKGTPVVASNIGGIPLQVIDGVSGYLHEPNDIEGFSKSVERIIKDERLREKLGKNGKEHVTRNFLITRLISDWIDLFKKYLD